jgi:hypothetical protein
MNIFGIRNKQTKQLMRISAFSNEGGEFCNSVGARFDTGDYDDSLYVVASYSVALESLKTDPNWYNSSLDRPQWPGGFDPLDWEVVTIEVK